MGGRKLKLVDFPSGHHRLNFKTEKPLLWDATQEEALQRTRRVQVTLSDLGDI